MIHTALDLMAPPMQTTDEILVAWRIKKLREEIAPEKFEKRNPGICLRESASDTTSEFE
jgi:hypothetical protein